MVLGDSINQIAQGTTGVDDDALILAILSLHDDADGALDGTQSAGKGLVGEGVEGGITEGFEDVGDAVTFGIAVIDEGGNNGSNAAALGEDLPVVALEGEVPEFGATLDGNANVPPVLVHDVCDGLDALCAADGALRLVVLDEEAREAEGDLGELFGAGVVAHAGDQGGDAALLADALDAVGRRACDVDEGDHAVLLDHGGLWEELEGAEEDGDGLGGEGEVAASGGGVVCDVADGEAAPGLDVLDALVLGEGGDDGLDAAAAAASLSQVRRASNRDGKAMVQTRCALWALPVTKLTRNSTAKP